MFEGLTFLHGMRLPVVIGVANRTLGAPLGGGGPDYSDSMSVRDFGIIQFYVEDNQEALDTVLLAYRVAEDPRVLLPVMVCIDGFYLSFSSEPVSIPDQEEVDTFLPPHWMIPSLIDPASPKALFCEPSATIHYEYQIQRVMEQVPRIIEEAEEEFFRIFGRRYGLLERYLCEDAEVVLVTVGSMTGTAREVVDKMREEGYPVGLAKLRVLRPFPVQEFRTLAHQCKVLAIIDRNVGHGGSGCGIVCQEVKAALYGLGSYPLILNFIVGLGGLDVSETHIYRLLKKALTTSRVGRTDGEVEWILPELPAEEGTVPKDQAQRLILPGTPSCAGCMATLVLRQTIETLGKDCCVIMPPGCLSVVNTVGWPGYSPVKVPFYMTTFASTAATASGVRAGLDQRGKPDNLVLGIAGDGGTADIGLQALSGAAERRESILYICYDNEAYMNTGIQRSGTTPLGAQTTTTPLGLLSRGNPLSIKDMPRIMAAHHIPYLATASVGYLEDYRRKLKKAAQMVKERRGLAYIHVHTPCSTGWRFPPSLGVEIARLAVKTNLWPLYEIEGGRLSLTKKVSSPLPVVEYTKLQGRFRHLDAQQLQELQDYADRLIRSIYDQMERGTGD